MIVALTGGVGGAKLALGLARILPPGELLIVVNTGDDFDHLGLRICPDLDTLMYTLAGRANPETGWGVANETWSFLEALEGIGGETWFKLGDRDLAVHVERTWRLRAGETLSAVTARFCGRLGFAHRIVPMSDDPVRTIVDTAEGSLDFQHYFVRRRAQPAVRGFEYAGVEYAAPSADFQAGLADPRLRAVVICNSNPFVSIRPILRIPAVERWLGSHRVPVVAVSPIVGGAAVKGPLAKMMRELGLDPSSESIRSIYAGIIDGFTIDRRDRRAAQSERLAPIPELVANTVMSDEAEKIALARAVVNFAARLGQSGSSK